MGSGATSSGAEASLDGVLGGTLMDKVRAARVLLVGAGGIGCELLKNLVMSGFRHIDVVDLDTIDVSNLNRQFLFRREHTGKSKSEVAAEAVRALRPDVHVTAHHGNVKDARFGPDFVRKFSLVMNALDNLEARRHVNRVCLAAEVPLVESGTSGYLGQSTVHVKGVSECFDCTPKPTPKSFPVCTIRSNPQKPIHCIVWAKLLFERLFGKANDWNSVSDLEADKSGASNSVRVASVDDATCVQSVFTKVYDTDIVELASMGDTWKERTPPQPLSFAALHAAKSAPDTVGMVRDRDVWTREQCVHVFEQAFCTLRARVLAGGSGADEVQLQFDKDDDAALDFVTACANLRSYIFGISPQSRFTVKADAGNIVPAIATTNAIVAGLVVLEAFKVLDGRVGDCRTTFCVRQAAGNHYLLPTPLMPPKPSCYVCAKGGVTVRCNLERTTMERFVKDILLGEMGVQFPSINLGFNTVYECGEDAEDMSGQLPKMLKDLGIKHNTIVSVDDFTQNLAVDVTLEHADAVVVGDGEPDEFGFLVSGTVAAKESGGSGASDAAKDASDSDSDGDVVVVVQRKDKGKGKRKRAASDAGADGGDAPAKKAKADEDAAIIVLD